MVNSLKAVRVDKKLNYFNRFLLFLLFVGGFGIIFWLTFFLHAFYFFLIINVLFIFILVFYLIIYFEKKDFGVPKKLDNFPSLSIIITCFNAQDTIAKCIESIQNLEYGKKIKLIVIDDASNDNSVSIIKKFKNVKLIALKENVGRADAGNIALKAVTTELVAFVDADTYPREDAVMRMVGCFDNDYSVKAVTCLVLPDRKKNLVEKVQYYEYLIGFGLWTTLMSFVRTSYVTPGPLTVFRRKVFDEIGGYDSCNLSEDMEFGLRIRKHGFKIHTCSSAIVYTVVPTKWVALFKQRLRWQRGNIYNFLLHKNLFFNKKNKTLGFIILPYFFGTQILAMFVLIKISLTFFESIFNHLMTSIVYFGSGGILFVNFNEIIISTMLLFFVLPYFFVIIYFLLSLHFTKTKLVVFDIPAIIILMFLYPYFLMFNYLISYLKEMFGVRQKWLRG
jgi:cellulose synthase/poly-beta-1,6-N-acetylglucosamine synthase-like glycosyltransferase